MFEDHTIRFSPGVNLFIGESGCGKTYLLKVLYAASQVDNVRFDDTYLDILNAAKVNVSAGRCSASKEDLLESLEEQIHGTVLYDAKRDAFYLKRGNAKQEFHLVAEGIRKLALLWQLIQNGTLEEGAVLFWVEPEANLSPSCVPIVVEILLQLQRNGVQVFLATHSYLVATYFKVRKTAQDNILFHSLSCADDALQYAASPKFDDLHRNTIIMQFNQLLDEIYAL